VSNPDLPIGITCESTSEGFRCQVTVGEDAAATHHEVTLTPSDLASLASPTTEPATLVRESFRFILAREPREDILRSFPLPRIGHYFPEYPAEIRRRLAKAG
jgi:hypothetical protein